MRCKACDKILEDSELTRKDVRGEYIDLCSTCLSASAGSGVESNVVNYYQNQIFTEDDDYDTLF
jgi:hypothetical protein